MQNQQSKSSKVRIGAVWKSDKNGRSSVFIALGQQSNNPKYNCTVEIVVKDGAGNIIARQSNGFVEVQDPRKRPEELLAANFITEEQAEQMREKVAKIPEKLRNELFIKRT